MADWEIVCIREGDEVPPGWEPFGVCVRADGVPGRGPYIVIYCKRQKPRRRLNQTDLEPPKGLV